ncbi:hypothetical protein DPMN_038316 [Dreissena polymorpha]|uniref:Uncharacterized protein n=1 Tax=Dreissena polymorpha TaxID=45954 RepID=A0A9D4RN28_DREPO|nr:hypothetical protein DPMN_038316 [Dreissena polymorpha]
MPREGHQCRIRDKDLSSGFNFPPTQPRRLRQLNEAQRRQIGIGYLHLRFKLKFDSHRDRPYWQRMEIVRGRNWGKALAAIRVVNTYSGTASGSVKLQKFLFASEDLPKPFG